MNKASTSAPGSPDDLAAARNDTIRPQDDLYRHVNGGWLAAHEIPADRGRDGVSHALHDQAQIDVRTLIEEADQVPADDPRAVDAHRIAALYASFMDTERIDAAGVDPIQPELERIRQAVDPDALAGVMGWLQRHGVGGGVGAYIDNDAQEVTQYRLYLMQSGLGLPDESYYREDSFAQIRVAYLDHVAQMLALAGVVDGEHAEQAAKTVISIETQIAAGHWDQVKDREAALTYNPMTEAEIVEALPGFDVHGWIRAMTGSTQALTKAVVREPDYLTAFAQVWAQTALPQLKLWLSWHVVHSRAPFLSSAVVDENFSFYGRTLTGAQQLRKRWKRAVSFAEGEIGESIGKLYVARHFPPSHKQRMDVLVEDLLAAYAESITNLEWMSPQTRERALAKLEKFRPKIGYPDRWRDFTGLTFTRDDLLANVRASAAFNTDFNLGKLERELDRDEWFMPPQMVNAYYNPGMNEIVFPAAILQPPFFDVDADPAANYGGIGAIIGHEIGHGFDDQGSRFDGDGRLADWWTAQDRAAFEQRTEALIAQYDALSPQQLAGSHQVNGAFTIGENIGDLGGLGIAVKAYRIALAREGREPTAQQLQQLFSSWAASWRLKARDEEVIRLLSIDPHSPDEFRCNQVVRNIDEFHEAFGTCEADGMWLPQDERVAIW
ncbi:MAG: M13 family metallopeptidase [Beutenbergiaceae bacterium]